jgi:hypothetical protein
MPNEKQIPWIKKALQAKIANEMSLRWKARSDKHVLDIRKELRKELHASLRVPFKDFDRNLKRVNRVFEPAFKILEKAGLCVPYEKQTCGTCADWRICKNTESWRKNQNCSHENGCFWKPVPNSQK